jgi:hypothetical protein
MPQPHHAYAFSCLCIFLLCAYLVPRVNICPLSVFASGSCYAGLPVISEEPITKQIFDRDLVPGANIDTGDQLFVLVLMLVLIICCELRVVDGAVYV